MGEAAKLSSSTGLRATTYVTLIGLLSATGIRPGEALALDVGGGVEADPAGAAAPALGALSGGPVAEDESSIASSSGHAGSRRTRSKSALSFASVLTPICARRRSMTMASPGRPLKLCARASRYMSSGSFGFPFRAASHARS